jgi:hypothetical protein
MTSRGKNDVSGNVTRVESNPDTISVAKPIGNIA